jgi:isopentenyl-diphosphate delta-isomerase
MTSIVKRKQRHIDISLEKDVQADIGTGFQDIQLVHRCLPEMDLEEVDASTSLFGKNLKAPLIISALTGGTREAKEINKILARVAEEYQIGMGVGSQRIAIEQTGTADTFSIVREMAPHALVFGNLGCPQLSLGWGAEEAEKCIEMVDADALVLHMNSLQESIQIDGDPQYRGVLQGIKELSLILNTPLVMKETGCGIAYEEAEELERAGVEALDISGLGGTSWAAVEYYLAKEAGKDRNAGLGKAFWNWGIPTAISLIEVQSTKMKTIASGGIRNGIDMAKAMTLGADAVGIAQPFLEKANQGYDTLKKYVENLIEELKVVMFLVGASSIEDLKRSAAIIRGPTAEWLRLRGFSPEAYAQKRF